MDQAIDTTLILYLLLGAAILSLALLGAGIYLINRWKKQVGQALVDLGNDLNAFVMQLEALQAVQHEYASLHRQPYTQLSAELQKKLNRLNDDILALEDAWGSLNTAHNHVPISQAQALRESITGPYHNQQAATAMRRQRERIYKQMGEAQTLARRLETLPGEIHGQARETGDGIAQLDSLLHELTEAGLHGKVVEEAGDALLRAQQGWARIPMEFIDPQPPDPNLRDVRDTTSAVFTILDDIQPLVDEWLPKVRDWQTQYRKAVDRYEQLRKTATNFRTAIDEPPPNLDVDEFRSELERVRATARALNQRLQEPLVEDLKALERETTHLEKVVQDSAGRYDRGTRDVAALDRVLLELESEFKQVEARLSEAEKDPTHPLQWDNTRPALAELSEKAAALGTRDTRRTPAQISEALTRAAGVSEKLRALSVTVDAMRARHQEFVSQLGSGSLLNDQRFTQELKALVQSVQGYDPANWPSQDNLETLVKEAARFEELQTAARESDRFGKPRESELGGSLRELNELSALNASLKGRMTRVRERLTQLQQVESAAKDDMARAAQVLDGLTLLAKDNPFLQEQITADVTRLRSELQRANQELANPQRGVVERKVSRANAVADGLSRSTAGWLEKLAANLSTHTRKLFETLTALDGIAALDDRAVSDARALVERFGPNPTLRKNGSGYAESAAELKRWSNDWQTCSAAARALEEYAAPVLESARETETARKAARAAFQTAGKLASGRRDWPPTRQSFDQDRQALQNLENRLDGLRSRRTNAAALVRELSQLYYEFDKLEDRVNNATRQAETEQGEAADLAGQIEALQQRWQGLAQRNPDQSDMDLEIKDLIATSGRRLAEIKNQYKRGAMDYDAVIAALKETINSLWSARFKTTEGQSVTLTAE